MTEAERELLFFVAYQMVELRSLDRPMTANFLQDLIRRVRSEAEREAVEQGR